MTHARGERHDQTADTDEVAADVVDPAAAERQEKLTEDVDALLDEIDDVLETNAEDFVRNYVQKGGE
jgi:ubiquitin-like protein Pup